MTPLQTHGMASCSSHVRRPLCVGTSRSHKESLDSAVLRSTSHYAASTSQSIAPAAVRCRKQRFCSGRRRVVSQALFDPPPFQPEKLAVLLAAGTTALQPAPPLSRKYTLTHNDITGNLRLTIGPDYNAEQISGFYTRLLRDEVIAEWVNVGSSAFALHVYCHVSGEERWLAPPLLRNYIFRREMPLVLDSLVYADRELLGLYPELAQAQVYVHFQSTVRELDTVEYWGVLGDRSTWPKGPTSILLRMIYAVVGWPPSLAAQPADLSIDLPSELLDVETAMRQQQVQEQLRQQQGVPVTGEQRSVDGKAVQEEEGRSAGQREREQEDGEEQRMEREPVVVMAAVVTAQPEPLWAGEQQGQRLEQDGPRGRRGSLGRRGADQRPELRPPQQSFQQQQLQQVGTAQRGSDGAAEATTASVAEARPAAVRAWASDAGGGAWAGNGASNGREERAPGPGTETAGWGPAVSGGAAGSDPSWRSSAALSGGDWETGNGGAGLLAPGVVTAATTAVQVQQPAPRANGAAHRDRGSQQPARPSPLPPPVPPSSQPRSQPTYVDQSPAVAVTVGGLRPSSGAPLPISQQAGPLLDCSGAADGGGLCSGGPGCSCEPDAVGGVAAAASRSSGNGSAVGGAAFPGSFRPPAGDEEDAQAVLVPATSSSGTFEGRAVGPRSPGAGSVLGAGGGAGPSTDLRAVPGERGLELAAAAAAARIRPVRSVSS